MEFYVLKQKSLSITILENDEMYKDPKLILKLKSKIFDDL